MSTQNKGNQTIVYKHQNPTDAENFNKYMCEIIKSGIYNGGLLSMNGDVLRVAAFTTFFQTSAGQGVKIFTSQNVESDLNAGTPLIPVTEIAPYIVANFTWVNQDANYLDFYAKAIGDIYDDDIVFGKSLWSAGSIVGFSYSEKTWGIIDQQGNIYAKNLILKESISYSGIQEYPREIDEMTLKADKNYLSVSPVGFKDNIELNFENDTIWRII